MSVSSSPASVGLPAALRAMGATLGEMARVRGALFAVELREEALRHGNMLALAALAAVLFHMTLLLLTVLVAVVAWDSNRAGAIAAMAAFYGACGGAVLLRLRAKAAASPAPFAATLGELDRDLANLRTPP